MNRSISMLHSRVKIVSHTRYTVPPIGNRMADTYIAQTTIVGFLDAMIAATADNTSNTTHR